MRANRTAASYNEYYLKNSFVWSGAVPSDIRGSRPYLEYGVKGSDAEQSRGS